MAGDKEAGTSSSKVELDYINTDTAAKNFAEMLNKKQTFFLDGPWGSGKTEFLKKTKKYSDKTFNELKLWEVKDKMTVTTTSFKSLFPKVYILSIVILILGAVGTIEKIELIKINLSKDLYYNIIILCAFALIITFGVFKSLSIKLDNIYIVMLDIFSREKVIFCFVNILRFSLFFLLIFNVLNIICYEFESLKSFILVGYPIFILVFILSVASDYTNIEETILVIDDFDRIPEKRQEEAYMVFNRLNGKLPIVFVGDYSNMARNVDRYLQKIIDTRVELPNDLHPSSIWDNYLKKLLIEIKKVEPDYEISVKFRTILIQEKRYIREIKHFNEFVNRELFEKGKLGHIQVDQQLWVIYVFLFHADYYNNLRDDIEFELSKEIIEYRNGGHQNLTGFDSAVSEHKLLCTKDMLIEALHSIQNYDYDVYPQPFSRAKKNYLLYESPSNVSVYELKKIIEDGVMLEENMLKNQDSDFYQYISSGYISFLLTDKKRLLDVSLELVKSDKISASIEYIIVKKNEDLIFAKGLTNREIFDLWKDILKEHGFDLSMMFYFFNKFYILSFEDLAEIFQYIDISKIYKRNDYILHVYVCSKGWARYNNWDDETFSAINSLTDEQFLSFWVLQELFSNRNYNKYTVPEDKTYIIYNAKKPDPGLPGSSYKLTLSYQVTIKKIKSRLEELENKGYTFIYKTGIYRD